jgi:transposase
LTQQTAGLLGQSQTGALFARSSGQLAKTDKLDAKVLARFGELVKPALTQFPIDQEELLSALLVCREQLIVMCVVECNRMELVIRLLSVIEFDE